MLCVKNIWIEKMVTHMTKTQFRERRRHVSLEYQDIAEIPEIKYPRVFCSWSVLVPSLLLLLTCTSKETSVFAARVSCGPSW